jgi:hypothetical protein
VKQKASEPEQSSSEATEVEEAHTNEPKHTPIPTAPEVAKKRRFQFSRTTWLVIGVVVLNLGVLGGTLYLRFVRPGPQSPQAAAVTAIPLAKTSQTESKPAPEPAKKAHYVSKDVGAEFDYPVDWRIQDGPWGVVLTSPLVAMKTADGGSVQGRVALNVYKNYQGVDISEDEEAVRAPEQLTYENPAPGQVPRTYASFFSYGTPQKPAGIFHYIVIGGSFNYQVGQHLKDKNYKAASPFVALYVQDSRAVHYFGLLPLSGDIWRDDATLQQARAVITSMRFN